MDESIANFVWPSCIGRSYNIVDPNEKKNWPKPNRNKVLLYFPHNDMDNSSTLNDDDYEVTWFKK